MKMLYECHGHFLMEGTDYAVSRAKHLNGPDRTVIADSLAALRAAGVTYFRDGGDALNVSVAAREMAADYGISRR